MNSNRGKEPRGRARAARPNTGQRGGAYQAGDKPYAERGRGRGTRGDRGRGRGKPKKEEGAKEMTAEDQFDMLFGGDEQPKPSPTKKGKKIS